jgi:hypothetical protein
LVHVGVKHAVVSALCARVAVLNVHSLHPHAAGTVDTANSLGPATATRQPPTLLPSTATTLPEPFSLPRSGRTRTNTCNGISHGVHLSSTASASRSVLRRRRVDTSSSETAASAGDCASTASQATSAPHVHTRYTAIARNKRAVHAQQQRRRGRASHNKGRRSSQRGVGVCTRRLLHLHGLL